MRRFLLGTFYSVSGDIGPGKQWDGFMPRGHSIGDALTVPRRGR